MNSRTQAAIGSASLLPSRDLSLQTGASNYALRTHRPCCSLPLTDAAEQVTRRPAGERSFGVWGGAATHHGSRADDRYVYYPSA